MSKNKTVFSASFRNIGSKLNQVRNLLRDN